MRRTLPTECSRLSASISIAQLPIKPYAIEYNHTTDRSITW